ncbi:hypothetical protein [Enterococcus wangshanyuanii]|uniref:Uncharacterized protein n=1 Tax=Enterococcus wangshanyuanii TaxID=2005703 RepID=A0ABQ1P0F4_9ENTE|nr:hypothetical protein [Enterococcus wangshanyuanii]GGC84389.1 hypothetical protein GCM10011573_12540 [Enterococcus wangshanyuanii]
MINRISVDEAALAIQSLFMKKNIVKGNLIPINENKEQAVLVFGTKSTGELIFKVDVFKNIYFRNNYEWQLIKN